MTEVRNTWELLDACSDPAVLLRAGRAALLTGGDPGAAADLIEDGLELDTSRETDDDMAEFLYAAAMARLTSMDVSLARDHLESFEQRTERTGTSNRAMIQIAFATGDLAESRVRLGGLPSNRVLAAIEYMLRIHHDALFATGLGRTAFPNSPRIGGDAEGLLKHFFGELIGITADSSSDTFTLAGAFAKWFEVADITGNHSLGIASYKLLEDAGYSWPEPFERAARLVEVRVARWRQDYESAESLLTVLALDLEQLSTEEDVEIALEHARNAAAMGRGNRSQELFELVEYTYRKNGWDLYADLVAAERNGSPLLGLLPDRAPVEAEPSPSHSLIIQVQFTDQFGAAELPEVGRLLGEMADGIAGSEYDGWEASDEDGTIYLYSHDPEALWQAIQDRAETELALAEYSVETKRL